MHLEARAAQKSGRQQGEIEQGGMRHSHGRKTQLQLRREAMRGDVLVTNAFEDLTIRHRRRTGRLTGETTDTFCGVKIRPLILGQSSRRFLTPQPQTTTR